MGTPSTLFASPRASAFHGHPTLEPSESRGSSGTLRGCECEWHAGKRAFDAMRSAYRTSGGLARSNDLARWLEDARCNGETPLTQRAQSGQFFGFDWSDEFWVPMFQFELPGLALKPAPQQVRLELSCAFDGWAQALWFAAPNAWLAERRPVDLLDTELSEVLAAARADRFIATG